MYFAIGETNPTPATAALLIGLALALALGALRGHKLKLNALSITLFSLLAPLLGALLSHALCLLMPGDFFEEGRPIAELLCFWRDGHMLYGGMLGCLLAALLSARCARVPFGRLLDAYAPSGALMIAVSRLIEGWMGQGYGEYLEQEGVGFPFAVYDTYYEMWAWALFVLEALIAVVLLVLLLCRFAKRRDGDGALLLIGLYAAAQIVLESLRRDNFLRWGFVRCSEVFSAVALAAVLLCYHRRSAVKSAVKWICWVVYALMIVLCLLLEFATEGRIPFLRFLDANGCYVVMACACAVLCADVLVMRGRADKPCLHENEAQAVR